MNASASIDASVKMCFGRTKTIPSRFGKIGSLSVLISMVCSSSTREPVYVPTREMSRDWLSGSL